MRSIVRLFFRITILPLVQLLYRVRRIGTGFVPREGGVLLLGNHVSYIDSFIMYLASPRPVRFVVLESYVNLPAIGWFLKLFGAIPIRPTRPKEALERTVEALRAGGVVCLFPEGGLTRLGVTCEFKKGFELIVRRAQVPVVPFYMDGLWSSIFSFERDRYFKKRPLAWTCPLQVAFGRPIPPGEASVDRVRAAVWEQSVEAFSLRRDFDRPLEVALVRALKRRPREVLFVEHGKKGVRRWTRAETLGVAMSIARRWRNASPGEGDRIGILLPPGPLTTMIHLGAFLAGRTPVSLPFTVEQAEMEALAKAVVPLGIRTVVTSRAFMPHFADFWQGDEGAFIDLKSVLSGTDAALTLLEKVRARWEPAWFACRRLGFHRRDPEREAAGHLSVSGEESVLLSSREVHRNALQATSTGFFPRETVVFSEDSLATPAGQALACWAPALAQGRVVSRSFSLRSDFEALEGCLVEEGVAIVAGRAAFFRSLDVPLAVRSLKYGLVFGETDPGELAECEERLELPLARGWEFAGRVVALSRTAPVSPEMPHHSAQRGRDPASVGRPLPGFAVQLAPDGRLSLRDRPVGESNDEGEWIEAPGRARIDADGFVYFGSAAESGGSGAGS